MSFADDIKTLAGHVSERMKNSKTEEATKIALIQPFIRALGYNINDPVEVVPEFTADVDPKRINRVDYAIMRDGKPIMLFECKAAKSKLDRDERWSQLFAYFMATEAKFGVLTNGVDYQFFSDLDQRNKMDRKPFLEFNLQDIDDSAIKELEKFTRDAFDLRNNWKAARDLKYTREIKRILSQELSNPSDQFIKFLASQMDIDRNITKAFKQRFVPLTKQAFNQFITDQAYTWMKSPTGNGNGATHEETKLAEVTAVDDVKPPKKGRGITTTDEELQGYLMVKSVIHDVVDVKRIRMRDMKGFCGVLLDGNQQKTICRLRFNSSKNKRLGLINNETKREDRVPIKDLDDIYKYADRLKDTVRSYGQPNPAG